MMNCLFRQVLIVLCFVIFGVASSSAQTPLPSQDPGHKYNAQIADVKFSVPKGFNLEQSSDPRVAFMRDKKYDLAMFVAVPETQVDEKYLTALSNTLVSQMSPKEKDFHWKLKTETVEEKVSKFQSSSGSTKGFNNNRFFQTHYITVVLNNREILVGYVTKGGQDSNEARYLFEREEASVMSMPGWYAQAHILASVTGEKYERLNPGTVIRAVPVN